MKGGLLYPLIERLGNLLRAEERQAGSVHGLQPVHLQALHYLSRCNRYSNTPAAVTDYLGLTKGTVSQTLLVLEKKRYIEKRPDAADRRIVHLALTPAGKRLLNEVVPPAALALAVSAIVPTELEKLENGLTNLLKAMQHAHGLRSFGVCHTCRFFLQEQDGYRCGLTRETLKTEEIAKICREHEQLQDIQERPTV